MPTKPNARNWNDVQTAIAAVTVVTTLGLWNLFATPSRKVLASDDQPNLPPTEPPVAATPVAEMPQVKIMFTQVVPQTTVIQQTQDKKKKNKKNGDNNNGGSVTQTQSS